MAILAQPIVFMSKMLSVNYGAGMPRNRGHGVWKPIVRKHGFFNVTSFEI